LAGLLVVRARGVIGGWFRSRGGWCGRWGVCGFVLFCSLVWCSSGFGAQTRLFVRSFGSFSNPEGIAVDDSTSAVSSGYVYVADPGNHRVQVFTGEGVFVLMFGKEVNKTEVELAGSEAEQDVCTAVSGDVCQAGTAGSTPGAFTTPSYLAVDNDPSSPSFHDVYVADTADDVVTKLTPEGAVVGSWGTGGQLDGSTTTAGSFGAINAITVAPSGVLYVLGGGGRLTPVFEFQAEKGKFITETTLEGVFPVTAGGVGVDAAGDVLRNSFGAIEEFAPGGGERVRAITGSAGGAFSLGVGGLFFAGAGGGLEHYAFNGAGEVVEPNGEGCAAHCVASDAVPVGLEGVGVGVSLGEDVYLSDPGSGEVVEYGPLVTIPEAVSEGASEVGPHSARLNGTVNPDGLALSECVFEYGPSTAYGSQAPCAEPDAGEVGAGVSPVAVHAVVSGLAAGSVYHFRVRASNTNGPGTPGADEVFETPPPPAIDSAAVSDLSAHTAVLNALIKPQQSKTTYHFEYDLGPYEVGEAEHGTRIPLHPNEDIVLAPGTTDVPVSAKLEGLEPEQRYYWRVVASNESGTTTSVQHTFIYTETAGGLPDNRAYELVTPAHKNGALIGDVFILGLLPQVAGDGQRVMSSAIQCFANSESCQASRGNSVGAPYMFSRTSSGWVATALAPPAPLFASQILWWGYSAQAGTALLSSPTPPEREDDFYLRETTGRFVDVGPNTPPEDGEQGANGGKQSAEAQAQSGDLSRFVWESPVAWPFEPETGPQTVYEYAGSGNAHPLLVGVSGGEGSLSLLSTCGTTIGLGGGNPPAQPGVVSVDGRVVFFTADGCPTGTHENAGRALKADEVFARVDGESAGAHTITVSESECGAGAGAGEVACRGATPENAGFVGASADGSRAFFLSAQQLTDGASEDSTGAVNANEKYGCTHVTVSAGCNLYGFDAGAPAGHGLVDVSEDVVDGRPRVQGVMGVSQDGSHVYFVAQGVLATAANERGEKARDGADNLYAWSAAGGVAFIATLPALDEEEWRFAPGRPANVSPDGRFLVFLSHGDLTADDTGRSGARQVFRYDAVTGVLNRVSVGDGGFNDDGNSSSPSPCNSGKGFETRCSLDAGLAQAYETGRSGPSMSADGSRVFFVSPVGLTAKALDDVKIAEGSEGQPVFAENVYEWEQAGAGSCPVVRLAGCVFLISDGRDVSVNNGASAVCDEQAGAFGVSSGVCLLGVDESGGDVFFTSADALVGGDTNTELDYYDARVCEPGRGNPCVVEPPPGLPGCSGEECHGVPPGSPGVPVAPSVGFSGAGNVTPGVVRAPVLTRAQKLAKALRSCRGRRVRSRRVACERLARRRYGPVRKVRRRVVGGHGRAK